MSFLIITNQVLTRLNEVNLTSANFNAATGFQSEAQNAVNNAIYDIHKVDFEWPFNYALGTQVLTGSKTSAGTTVYSLPANYSTVDWDTFYLNRDDTLNPKATGTWIPYIEYQDWAQNYRGNDDNITNGSGNHAPFKVTKDYTNNFIVTPPPDQNYKITFNYWTIPTGLVAYSDLPTVPSRFWPIIVDGAMMYCYLFRENFETAALMRDQFQKGITAMRKMVVNQKQYARAV